MSPTAKSCQRVTARELCCQNVRTAREHDDEGRSDADVRFDVDATAVTLDSDGDRVHDGAECQLGTNPVNGNSKPPQYVMPDGDLDAMRRMVDGQVRGARETVIAARCIGVIHRSWSYRRSRSRGGSR